MTPRGATTPCGVTTGNLKALLWDKCALNKHHLSFVLISLKLRNVNLRKGRNPALSVASLSVPGAGVTLSVQCLYPCIHLLRGSLCLPPSFLLA